MKKIITLVAALLAAGFVFAEKFEVKSVIGTVTYEAAPGKMEKVKVGQKLSDASILTTSINSNVVLTGEDGKDVTIKPAQKGTIASLVKANTLTASRIKKNPPATSAKSIAGEAGDITKGTATASSRASEAKDDFELDED